MKSVSQILEYIDGFYRRSAERPEFYFKDAQSMESELEAFESLYEFIVDDSREPSGPSRGFSEFLFQNGYGTLGFCQGRVDEGIRPSLAPSSEEKDKMRRLADFWIAYLGSGVREGNK